MILLIAPRRQERKENQKSPFIPLCQRGKEGDLKNLRTLCAFCASHSDFIAARRQRAFVVSNF
jgi:hypothetical protein